MAVGMLRSWRIRPLLFVSYGCTVCTAFVVTLLLSLISVYSLRARVLSVGKDSLKEQIKSNSLYIVTEAARVFEAKLDTGLHAFVLPAVYGMVDAAVKDDQYSVAPPKSYADATKDDLKQPLSTDPRYTCSPIADNIDRIRGCANGMQQISLGASSLYITGFDALGDDVHTMMAAPAIQDPINFSSYMDHFVRSTWLSNDKWVESFLAVKDGKLYRQFPGVVGDLKPYSGPRSYDPTVRPWYTAAEGNRVTTSMTMNGVGEFYTSRPAPYYDQFGKGFLLPLIVPFLAGDFGGVAGTDLQCSNLKQIVQIVRIRQTGKAHLFHVASGTIAASPQWGASRNDNVLPLRDVDLKDGLKFGDASLFGGVSACSSTTSDELEDMLVVYRPVLGRDFCIVAATPMEEVLQPINDKEDDINDATTSLFVTTLIVCLICFAVVAICVVWLALRMSSPLIATRRDTEQIVQNIGGNLFEGISTERKTAGVGEVEQLRCSFVNMLGELLAKRNKVVVPPENPFAGCSWPGARPPTVALKCEKAAPTASDDEPTSVVEAKLTMCNRIITHLITKLIAPMVLALAVIIIMTCVNMSASAHDWVAPMKEVMLKEELSTLDMRAYELSQLVSEIMVSYVNTLEMVQEYTEDVFEGNLPLRSPYASPFSPGSYCSQFAASKKPADCAARALELDTKRYLTDSGNAFRSVGLESSAWYAPATPLAPFGTRGSQSAADQQQGLGSHLDNVLRVAYFSSKVVYVYLGFEATEAYRMYPYQELDSFMEGIDCVGTSTRVPRYTPLCRQWYRNAVADPGKVIFNPVDIDANTLMPYVSLSVTAYAGSTLIGVVAVDANLGALANTLAATKLYDKGYAYIYDQEGFGIIHKNIKGRRGQFRVEDLEAGSDQEFKTAFVQNVLPKTGQSGTWVYPWKNPDTNEFEDWHYSFLPVPGTPYQLVLTVLATEVQASGQDVEDRLIQVVAIHATITSIVFALSLALLVFVSYWFNKSFAEPIEVLVDFIHDSKSSGYRKSVSDYPSLQQDVTSAELQGVLVNISKMLVALRFGNPAYSQGNKMMELQSIRDARELVEATGNKRGVGVCLSNFGNFVRTLKKGQTQVHSSLGVTERDATKLLQQAVDNAKELVAAGEEGVTKDTVGQRLFGLALAHLKQNQLQEAAAAVREAVKLHTETGGWTQLSTIAYIIATQHSEKLELEGEATRGADAAMAILAKQECVKPGECAAAAKLYFAMYVLKDQDKSFIRAALQQLPHLDEPMLVRLAKYAKLLEGEEIVRMVDAKMANVGNWVSGPLHSTGEGLGPKAIIFLVDRTWAPILPLAVQSVRKVFENNTQDDDYVGYYSLGDGWIFPPTRKLDAEDMLRQKITASDAMAGRPLLYASMAACLRQLSALKVESKWLIVLSDTVDLEEPCDQDILQPGMSVMAKRGAYYQEAVVKEVQSGQAEQVTVQWQGAAKADGADAAAASAGRGSRLGQEGVRLPGAPEASPRPDTIGRPSETNVGVQENAPLIARSGGDGQESCVARAECQRFAPEPMDRDMDQRLRKAGARTGQVTISLMWNNVGSNRTDLDLHTQPPNASEIYYGNKRSGGGWLDVDMQAGATNPVENCFFENIADGCYRSKVRNYGGGVSKMDFKVCLRARVPITLRPSGEVLQGLKMVQGTCNGTGPGSDVGVFDFEVRKVEPTPAQRAAIQSRPNEVAQLLSAPGLNLVIIDSREISGWNPTSPKWTQFKSNIELFVKALGPKGHHLPARNAEDVTQRFEEVAAMIDDAGLEEQL